MKVLIANTRHYPGGGDSTYAFNLADLLKSNGNDVVFFAMKGERNIPDPNADLFVSHIDFRELNKHKSFSTALKVLGRVIYSTKARNKFAKILDREKPDVVHLHNIHAHITPSIIFEAKKQKIPVVWTLHDYKLICPNSHFLIDATGEICEACQKHQYFQPVLKRCKKNSLLASSMASLEAFAHLLMGVRELVDIYLAPSQFLKNKLIDRDFPSSKVCHLPYVLPRNKHHKNYNIGKYFLFFGRIEGIKGILPLLDACKLIPDAKLLLAGRVDGSLVDQLPDLLPDNAKYVGMKHGTELHRLLEGAFSVVVPSIWYENQPFSILEAFAYSKPVIASDLGGMSELVLHGERGLLVPPGDVDALADAMQWMQHNRKDAIRMGENAYSYAVEQHGEELHYQRIMAIYEQIIK